MCLCVSVCVVWWYGMCETHSLGFLYSVGPQKRQEKLIFIQNHCFAFKIQTKHTKNPTQKNTHTHTHAHTQSPHIDWKLLPTSTVTWTQMTESVRAFVCLSAKISALEEGEKNWQGCAFTEETKPAFTSFCLCLFFSFCFCLFIVSTRLCVLVFIENWIKFKWKKDRRWRKKVGIDRKEGTNTHTSQQQFYSCRFEQNQHMLTWTRK